MRRIRVFRISSNAQKIAIFPVEQVVHKMTGKTAERFGIKKRGLIAEGNFADITVFDFDAIEVNPDVPDFTPKGIEYVMVNGCFAVDNGNYSPVKAGRVVLKK